jgi:uncharacterized protein (TIGR00255 family)
MTGFARADGTAGHGRFHWELRSVNGRGLDVRLRLPSGYETLERNVREAVAKEMTRGNVSVTLSVDTGAASSAVRINEGVLALMLATVERLSDGGRLAPATPEGVLGLKGVIELGEPAEGDSEFAKAGILAALETGLRDLTSSRRAEGQRLEAVIVTQVDEIERLVGRISTLPGRSPDAVRARLADLVQRLIGTGVGLDPERLHQEAVIVATRADVEEELKRLGAHIAAARQLVSETAASGRRLDFLAQEFNREANTICSKSGDVEMTRLGLDLKAVIDQLREQVQNIE